MGLKTMLCQDCGSSNIEWETTTKAYWDSANNRYKSQVIYRHHLSNPKCQDCESRKPPMTFEVDKLRKLHTRDEVREGK